MRETAWLIESEKDGVPVWWNPVAWTPDSLHATRFARQEDAQSLIDCFEIDKAKATEHIWED